MKENVKRPISKLGQALPLELRNRAIGGASSQGSQSFIQKDLLDHIYDVQYDQSVKEPDPKKWRCQIVYQSQVAGAEKTPAGPVRLVVQIEDGDNLKQEHGEFDLVISATGYERSECKRILAPLTGLLDGHKITVNRDYQVNLRSGSASTKCGVWLQGSLADGEDVSVQDSPSLDPTPVNIY